MSNGVEIQFIPLDFDNSGNLLKIKIYLCGCLVVWIKNNFYVPHQILSRQKATRWADRESYFLFIFRRLQKAAEKCFFLSLVFWAIPPGR